MSTVLHVIEGLSQFGGTARLLRNLVDASRVTALRHEFLVYQESPMAAEFTASGARVHAISSLQPATIARELCSLVKRDRPLAIASHFTRPLLAGYLAAVAVRLPLIHHEHSSPSYRHGMSGAIAALVRSRAAGIICVSDHVAKEVGRQLPRARRPPDTWHPPVTARRAERTRAAVRAELGVDPVAPLILHVGGMIPERDQQTLLAAFSKVLQTRPTARLVLAGDGPQRHELEKHAAALRITDRVCFAGYRSDVGDLLSAADLYVNPTKDEGLGLAVIEAMLAGVPVIAANAGAHSEYIRDGVDGHLYPGGDAARLAASIEMTLHDSGATRQVEYARSRAREMFDAATAAQAYAGLVQSICAPRLSGSNDLRRA